MTGAFDPGRLLQVLTKHRVRFVLIGGLAGRLWGSPTVTNDLDICYARDRANLARLAAALNELDATLRGAPRAVPFQLDDETLSPGDHFTFATTAGNLDLLGQPAGSHGFDALARTASTMRLAGSDVLVADLDDLMSMKRAAGRPKDRVELEVLSALREERAAQRDD